jgi:hypothetical protein
MSNIPKLYVTNFLTGVAWLARPQLVKLEKLYAVTAVLARTI